MQGRDRLQRADLVGDVGLELLDREVDDAAAEALQVGEAGMGADRDAVLLAQSFTVSTITTGSLAWKPQATLADFTIFRTSASLPITQGPKLSPRSELILTSLRWWLRPWETPLIEGVILADVSVRYLSCGDTAFTVEFGNEISPEINGKVMALHADIGRRQGRRQPAGRGRDRAHHALADGEL